MGKQAPKKVVAKKSLAKAEPKIVIQLSDLHCGSDCGLVPEYLESEDGHPLGYGSNKFQAWMWKCWQDLQLKIDAATNGDPFILVLNGDLIEGKHHGSEEIIAAKIMDHLKIAVHCLAPLAAKAHTLHFVRGTECHVRDLETVIAQQFDGAGKARDIVQFKVNGILYNAIHHMPTTSRLHLEGNAFSVTMANNRSHASRAGHELPSIFMRGHRHVHGFQSDGTSMMSVCGAWQGLTRFGHKVVDAVPRPSCFIYDHRGTDFNELPKVQQIVYTPPQDIILHQS